jgi:hypothetical protein
MTYRDLRQSLPVKLHSLPRLSLKRAASVPRVAVAIVAALAFVCMIVAALAGWGVGRALRSPSPNAAGASRTVTVGLARLQVPPTWTAIKPASANIPGLDPTSTRAFRIDDGLAQHAVVTLAPPADRWLIPSSLRPALRPPLGAPIPTFLADYPAWSYSSVATARPNVVMQLTVLPTSAGVLAVACTSRSVVAGPSQCDQDVAQISVSDARVLRPTPETAFRFAMSPVLTRLQDDRAALERELNAARDAGAQAQALQAFGKAYAAAARGLDPLAPRLGRAAILVASLHNAASAYRAAGMAANTGAFGDYFVARAAVTAAESHVAKVLAHGD